MLNSSLGNLRVIAFLEGCSFLLLGITMPLKYKWAIPEPNYVVGMVHGILFMAYVVLVIVVAIQYKWTWFKTLMAFLASIIPFGTFYADVKLFRTTSK